ncbi:uncharacterized protein LOC122864700 [Siniperca chuatsi]|uniref:uncharacterized protein LOC122864700 n=1 Tax=Siniperca chuatsi TaxID=119488 RepID=UPI001CE09AED|nr:uncharacterized protein LOC122864700 [Siniperca chuatsi]
MCAVQLLRVSVQERISAAAEDFLLRVEKGREAAEIPALRALLTERLAAAAEEIVGLFEETVAEYEDRAERSEREIRRQRRLLDAVLKPEVRLHRADVQQLSLSREEVPPEQQDWSPSLDQDPEPPHIKEEQEELWTSQEGEQLRGLEEADITKFPFTPVPVKSEEDEEKPQSSQLHQSQTEQMETGADGEDCGGPGPARNSDPDTRLQPDTTDASEPETEDSDDDREETRDPQSDVQQLSLRKEEVPPEQQDWSPSLDQDPEPPHIKEEQEELWTSQEGGALRGLEEADITKFPFTPVPVKNLLGVTSSKATSVSVIHRSFIKLRRTERQSLQPAAQLDRCKQELMERTVEDQILTTRLQTLRNLRLN